jgi:hypothetical protein
MNRMLSLVMANSEATPVARLGPYETVCVDSQTLRAGEGNEPIARYTDGRWRIGNERFYRVDCEGPVWVTLAGCPAEEALLGPFEHFSVADGVAFASREPFARLVGDTWYVNPAKQSCPAIVLRAGIR